MYDENLVTAQTALSLAEVSMQAENAAEVQKAKDAARAELEEEREAREVERAEELADIMDRQAEFLSQRKEENINIDNLKRKIT
jgi:hypothetical protein